jgi:uncharacterized protein (DUF952 family)
MGRGSMERPIYEIATGEQWAEAERAGSFLGASVDLEDGFIHLSTASQNTQLGCPVPT